MKDSFALPEPENQFGLSKYVIGEDVGECYAIGIKDDARPLVPFGEIAVIDMDAECVAKDLVIAWRNGVPCVFRLRLALSPNSIQSSGDVIPMVAFETADRRSIAVPRDEFQAVHKIIGVVDDEHSYFPIENLRELLATDTVH